MITPYPIRTEPFLRDYLWGGRKLQTQLGKTIPADGIWAESWEMIDHPEHQSLITNGELAGQTLRELARNEPTWLFGSHDNRPSTFPLLLKYLDCQRVLSVQVHPKDDYAQEMSPPDLGKTEAWYIVAAEPGSKLFAGLMENVTPDQLKSAIASGTVEECLHVIHPQAGDCVFIPAGTVHALGAGLLVAEIQQASNTTFRLFDWNRVDANGNARELHVDQALEVIDFAAGPRELQRPISSSHPGRETLVRCDKFILDRIHGVDSADVGDDGIFHLLTAPYGGVKLSWVSKQPHAEITQSETLDVGQSVLLPAALPSLHIELTADAVLLDMYLP